MERSNYRIMLDIQGGGGCQLDMKRGDTHRRLHADLTDGGVPYVLTEQCYPVLMAKTPDLRLLYAPCKAEGNTVICDIPSGITAAAGLVRCELRLYNAPFPQEPDAEDVELLTSAAFVIRVLPTVYTEDDEAAVAASAEGTALTQLVSRALDATALATQTADSLRDARAAGEFDGTSVTHRWEDTVLFVTSASGTTSADLKGEKGEQGEKGEKGDRGPQGAPGTVNIDDTTVGADAWSSKNTVDKLCPAFAESGPLVQCQPVEGYPLEVSIPEGATLTHCGKNLFDSNTYNFTEGVYILGSGGITGLTMESKYAACLDFIPVGHLCGKQISLNHPPIETNGSGPKMVFYTSADEDSVITGANTNGYTITVPDNASYMRFSIPKSYADGTQIQIEIGSEPTEHEAYCQGNGSSALSGINTFFAYYDVDAVQVKVKGRSDPVAIIDKLTKAVLSLGGNV